MKTGTNDMKTGTDVDETGVYESECCHCEIEFSKDQTFTRCPRCSSLTRWELVEMDMDMDLPLAA
jgi:Zn finger protein HypA/HybF involved in hydrogenase expression